MDVVWTFIDGLFARIASDPWTGSILIATFAAAFGALLGFLLHRVSGEAEPTPAPTLLAPPSPERAMEAESEAVANFRDRLSELGVDGHEQDARVARFAGQYDELVFGLSAIQASDSDAGVMIEQAREALNSGDIPLAVETLDKAAERDAEKGREMERKALERFHAAAAIKDMAGDLETAQQAHAAAASFYRDAARMPPGDDKPTIAYLSKHAAAAYAAGDHDGAFESYGKAAAACERIAGDADPSTATALCNLAMIHYNRASYEEAEKLYLRALAIDEQSLGEDHPAVARDLNNLALLHKKRGDLEKAEPLLKRSLQIKEKHLDPNDPSLVTGLRNYAALLRAVIRREERELLKSRKRAETVKARAVVSVPAGRKPREAEAGRSRIDDRSVRAEAGDGGKSAFSAAPAKPAVKARAVATAKKVVKPPVDGKDGKPTEPTSA